MPRRAHEVAAVALVLAQAAWLAAGFAFPALPGWTMFSKVEPARARLVDGGGQAVEIHDLIPADVYLIDRPGTRAIASWECRTNIQRGPWTLEWPDGTSEKPCAP